ncbi:MAG: F-box protein, partial [Parachlamydia sp.]|nr:F-box protein [Parachlamydia sp.]
MTTPSVKPSSLSGQRLLDTWNSFEPVNKAQCRKRNQRVLALLQTLKPFFQRTDIEKMGELRAKVESEAKLAEEVDTCIATIGRYPTEGPVRILPQEVWQLIFSFLTSRKDHFNLMLVCRQWAVFAKDPKMLASMLERGCLGKLHFSQLQKLMQQCGSEVRTLDLPSLLTEEEQNRLNNENLSVLLHACPSLQSLSLSTVNRLGGKDTTSVEELRKILVATGIAKTLCVLCVANCPGMNEKELKELTLCCPNLKPENVHYISCEDYYRTAYREVVKKGAPLVRCLTLTEEEKKIYRDKCGAVHFLVGLGFDFDKLFKEPALLNIYSDSNRRGALLGLIKFGIRPSILRSLPTNSLKYLYETISCHGDLAKIAKDLPSLDSASFKLVLDHSRAIENLMFYGMDFEDFSSLPYEQRYYVLQHHDDFAILIRTFAEYHNFNLATFLQAPEENRKIIVQRPSTIRYLLDQQGEPLEALLKLDRETFWDNYCHWCSVSDFLKEHGSANLEKVYQLPQAQRKAAIANLVGLSTLLREGMTIEALQDVNPERIEYVLRNPLA